MNDLPPAPAAHPSGAAEPPGARSDTTVAASGPAAPDLDGQRRATRPAALRRAQAARNRRRRWLLSRCLATLGAALFAVAAWLPWVIADGRDAAGNPVAFYLSPGDLQTNTGDLGWAALTVAGVLLLPWLWRRASRRAQELPAIALYTLWVLLALVASVTLGFFASTFINFTQLVPAPGMAITGAPQLLIGFWIAFGGAVCALVAIVVMLSDITQPPIAAAERSEFSLMNTLARIPGAGVLTLALLVWALAAYLTAWATSGCTQLSLFSVGTCEGITFSQALDIRITAIRMGVAASSVGAASLTFDGEAANYAIGMLLGVGALLLVGAIWRRLHPAPLAVWLAVWLATATVFAVLGGQGATLAAAHPQTYHLPGDGWRASAAPFFCLLALIAGWGAALYLVLIAALGRRRVAPTGGTP